MSYYHQIDGQRVDHSSRCPFGDRDVYRKYNVLAKTNNTMATVADGVGWSGTYCVLITSFKNTSLIMWHQLALHITGQ